MKILVVGGGSIGRRHIQNLNTLKDHEIYVLKRNYDENFAKNYNVCVVTSFDDPLLDNIECVFVATPTSLHNESLLFANERKLHVFMEKPLIHNQVGKEEAVSIWKNKESVFFIGYMLRFHPLVKEIYSLIKNQTLGPVFSARFEFGSYLPNWHPYEDYKLSYAVKRNLGGGVINTITHEIDLIQYFFGMPDDVYCVSSNNNILGIEVEEQCEAILQYRDKIVTLHLDFLQKKYDRNIKVLCENGTILWNWHSNRLIIIDDKNEEKIIPFNTEFNVNQLYIDELNSFFELINLKKNDHSLDFEYAVENAELMIMLSHSAEKNKKNLYK